MWGCLGLGYPYNDVGVDEEIGCRRERFVLNYCRGEDRKVHHVTRRFPDYAFNINHSKYNYMRTSTARTFLLNYQRCRYREQPRYYATIITTRSGDCAVDGQTVNSAQLVSLLIGCDVLLNYAFMRKWCAFWKSNEVRANSTVFQECSDSTQEVPLSR